MDTPDGPTDPKILIVRNDSDFPPGIDRQTLAEFFHNHMKPYEDTMKDVHQAISDAFDGRPGPGGFILLATSDDILVGALLMLGTGMKGYVPSHILLFVGVHPTLRGHGIGGRLVKKGIAEAGGDVKLHVEYDNPAKRLYERLGFKSKYADMRLEK